MVDWSSTEELETDELVFEKFVHTLAGLFLWEFATSLDFDWNYLSGKRKASWALIPYFAGRYLMLGAIIGLFIGLDNPDPINCRVLYTFEQLAGDAALGMASINLSLRTIAVWNMNKYIIWGLILIILGHWSLILQGVLLKAVYVAGEGCDITYTNNTVLAATFIYSMCFDGFILVLNVIKLAPRRGNSTLMKLLFRDGLVYFFVAFIANLLATVFMLLDLNSIMNVIFNVPACTLATIAACRVVRRLSSYRLDGPAVYGSSGVGTATGPIRAALPSNMHVTSGVHVQMETFEAPDDHSLGESKVTRDLESGKIADFRSF